MNVESESILLRRREFFRQYDIEVQLRKEVSSYFYSLCYSCAHLPGLNELFSVVQSVSLRLCCLSLQALSVNTDAKTVTFDDGSVQSYDQLLIATGSRYGLLELGLFLSI